MRARRPVNHAFLAGICARHLSGNYVAAVDRCCEQLRLPAADRLRIQRLAKQQAAMQKAIERATALGSSYIRAAKEEG